MVDKIRRCRLEIKLVPKPPVDDDIDFFEFQTHEDDPQGELAILPWTMYKEMVDRIERFADRLQVEIIQRGLAERRLEEARVELELMKSRVTRLTKRIEEGKKEIAELKLNNSRYRGQSPIHHLAMQLNDMARFNVSQEQL